MEILESRLLQIRQEMRFRFIMMEYIIFFR